MDCYNCALTAAAERAPREEIVLTEHWRAGHAFNTTLPGWLVIAPLRHVEAFTELSREACAELGELIHDLSTALVEVTGCVKTYVMQFSEAEGFSHLHVHLVPRIPDQPAEQTGPRIFGHLTEPGEPCLSEEERDRIALALRDAVAG